MTIRRTHFHILIILLVLVLGFMAYSIFFTEKAGAQSSGPGDNYSAIINKINSIELGTAIFEDPAFLSLVDGTIPILPQPVGKSNPFAPFSSSQQPAKTVAPAKTTPRR
jgi:hypothetical protein